MKLDKILAMGAYGVQAVATLALVFAVSHLLTGGEYGHYSLIVASAQSAAVLAFEWVRLAASRFCANLGADDMRSRKDTVQASFLMAACAIAALAVGAVAVGVLSVSETLVGLAITLLIGITDLLLVFLRVQGSFNQFAILQMVRAFSLLAGSVAGAFWWQTAQGALLGLCAGYAFTLLVYVLAAPTWWKWSARNFEPTLFRSLAVYGVSVAAASNIHLQVPLLIRWLGKAFLPEAGFAGLSLAMDILQKPFALVTSAIGGVLTPGVIVEFEEAKNPHAPKLRQLYEIQLWCVVLMLGFAIALLPDLCALLIKAELRDWVVHFGVPVALVFAGHTLLQTTISIPGHLLHMGGRLIGHAVLELSCVAMLMSTVLYVADLRPYVWLWLGALAVFISIALAFPLVRKVPCKLPVAAIYIGGLVAFVQALLYFADTQGNLLLMIGKAILTAGIGVLGLWCYRIVSK